LSKNFLFVVPRFANKGGYYPFPYGLASVVASMKQHGFNVFVLNLCHQEGDIKELLYLALNSNHIDVVCTGGMSLHWNEVAEVINNVKEIAPETIIVVGGAIVTSDPVLVLQALRIDYGVIGEGERTMVELASFLCYCRGVKDIKGICFKEDGGVVWSEPDPIKDLDALPYPDLDVLGFKEWLETNKEKSVDVVASRSCPFHCTFCYHPLGDKYRQHSLGYIMDEVRMLKEKYGIVTINFQDELFSVNKERVLKFALMIKPLGISYFIQWRVDNVDEEMLVALKDSGCKTLELGVESYSDIILESMKKGITKAQIDKAYELCDKVGINVTSNIIIGDPAETEETVKESLGFVRMHPDHIINVGFILAIPSSMLWINALATGRITDKLGFIKKRFPVINLTCMSDWRFNRIRKHIRVENLKRQSERSLLFYLKVLGILLLDENGRLYSMLKRNHVVLS
jgi:anaerobic magnesium-protoporphyrin IX monomethyl ester cyclase